jgi:hypothetical protein
MPTNREAKSVLVVFVVFRRFASTMWQAVAGNGRQSQTTGSPSF